MSRNWLSVADEDRLLDEVAQRRVRLTATRLSITPQEGALAAQWADAYPWMHAGAIQGMAQAGFAADDPASVAIADQAARQAAEDGQFETPAEDVPDAWYETLWHAATDWAKPIVRTGFTALSVPFEELQALLSSAGTALFDETEAGEAGLLSNIGETISALAGELTDPGDLIADFWTNYTEKAARSSGVLALSDLLAGKHVDLGQGFLPGGKIWEEREAAKYRLQLDGQFVTPGRIFARQFVEPGTGAYQFLSGALDFAQNIALDPTVIAFAGLSKAQKAHRAFQTIGLIPGTRKTVAVEKGVDFFVQHPAGQKLVKMWTANRDTYAAWKSLGSPDAGGMGMEAARRLAATTNDTDTVRVLTGLDENFPMGILGTVVRERPSVRFTQRQLGGGRFLGGIARNEFGQLIGHGSRAARADDSRLGFLARTGRLGGVPAVDEVAGFRVQWNVGGRSFHLEDVAHTTRRTARDNTRTRVVVLKDGTEIEVPSSVFDEVRAATDEWTGRAARITAPLEGGDGRALQDVSFAEAFADELAAAGVATVGEAGGAGLGVLGRAARLRANLPTGPISAMNIDNAAVQLDRWMVNAQVPEVTRARVIGELSGVTGQATFEGVAETGAKAVAHVLQDHWGISESRARDLTRLFGDVQDGHRVFDLDDLGGHLDVLKPLRPVVDGAPMDVSPMPAMIAELADDIYLPNVREIRRLTPMVKELQGLYDSGLWKGTVDGIRAVQSAAWMPLNILRNALTIRVVGDGQTRMAGAGYDSFINHPMDAVAWMLAHDPKSAHWQRFQKLLTSDKNPVKLKPRGTETLGGQGWEDFTWLQNSMERGSGGWLGLPGQVLTGNYVKAKYGQPGFYEGWADKLSHMANDPVYRRVAGGLSEGDLRTIGRTRPKPVSPDPDFIEFDMDIVQWTALEERLLFRQLERELADNEPDLIRRMSELADLDPDDPRIIDKLRESFDDEPGLYPKELLSDDLGAPSQAELYGMPADMHAGDHFEDVFDWFWKGTGQEWRKELGAIEGRSALLTDPEAARGYLRQNFFEPLERATGGDPDLVQFVATGRLGKVNARASGHAKGLTKTLQDSYDHAAPASTGTPQAVSSGRRNQLAEAFNHLTEVGFEKILTDPENYLTKSITFRQMFFNRVEEIIGHAPRKLQEDIIRRAREVGMDDSYLAKLATKVNRGEGTRLENMRQVDMLAGSWAMSETKKLLYNLADRNQFMDMFKVIFPFGDVWKNVVTSWLKVVRQNPSVVRRFQQGLEGARQPSVFGEAETTPGSGQGFFHMDPNTGEEVFTYPMLGSLATGMLGLPKGSVEFVGRAAGLNLVTSTVLPGFGPAVTIPASHIIPNTPQWDTVRDILLPFGETESLVEQLTPRWAQQLKQFFSEPNPDTHRLFANTVADVMRVLAPTGKHDMSTPEGQQALLDEATAIAKDLYVIRGIAQFNLPTGPSLQWNVEDVQGNLVPVKLLSDDLRRLTEEYGGDRTAAFGEWVKRYGAENVLSVIPKSTSIVDRPVTEKGDAWLRAHPEEERDFAATIGFFAPEDAVGDFDYTAYLRQIETGAREGVSPAEQLALANDFLGRVQFENAKKIAAVHPGPVSSMFLAQVRQQLAEEYPGFDGWVSRSIWEKKPKADELIDELRDAVQNPSLANTDAGQGIIKYLSAIDVANQMVTQLPGNTRHYQQAKSAAPIRFWLRMVARDIIEQHPDFARTWTMVFDRELADDDQPALAPAA